MSDRVQEFACISFLTPDIISHSNCTICLVVVLQVCRLLKNQSVSANILVPIGLLFSPCLIVWIVSSKVFLVSLMHWFR